MTKELAGVLHHAAELITNGQAHAEVAAAMAAYGYDAPRWAAGQALLTAAQDQVRASETALAAQLGATDAFNAAFDTAWEQAQALARLCAELFKGQTEALRLLGLHKRRDAATGESEIAWPRKRNLVHFLAWARNLYAVAQAHNAVTARLADFGYPAARLAAEAAAVETMAQADSAQEIAKAQAQQRTVDRDEAVEALRAWVRQAETVAKLALQGRRQLLELVGLRAQRR
jgi:hypothetical protein